MYNIGDTILTKDFHKRYDGKRPVVIRDIYLSFDNKPRYVFICWNGELLSSNLKLEQIERKATEQEIKDYKPPIFYTEDEMHNLMDEYQQYLFNCETELLTFKEWFKTIK